jgi:hypothetical protein
MRFVPWEAGLVALDNGKDFACNGDKSENPGQLSKPWGDCRLAFLFSHYSTIG